MCGIAGFVGNGSMDDLRRMNAVQRSRGPDAEGTYHDPSAAIFLGHQRLSIIDHNGGAQPMWSHDRQTGVTFNGEIYNHAELRKELRALGACFLSDHSDTEVLLHAYRHWGDNFVEKLNGMWAFVLYDRSRRRLFGSRDRFGKKPFYYTRRSGFFAFASELTALAAHPAVPNQISQLALQKYFAYGYIPAPYAYLEGVFKLPGGHSFSYDLCDGTFKTWRYWKFTLEPDTTMESANENALGEELALLLRQSVKRRLVADVPIGTFLSGGIDSSAISALAAQCLTTGTLQTFNIGFTDASFDESRHALKVAEHIGSNHHHHVFSETTAREALPKILRRLDEPMGDSSLLPTWFLCNHAKKHVTVALGGDGADELFAGYDPFLALRWANCYQRLTPKPVHRAISLLAQKLPVSHRNMSLDFKIKRFLRGLDHPPSLWCPVWMASISPDEFKSLFLKPLELEAIYSDAIECWDQCEDTELVGKASNFYVNFYLQDDILTKIDRASMAHSLEIRAPFLDIDVVDFARRLPSKWKLQSGRTKYLLKSALSSLLPHEILHRPKKGFGTPIGGWFRDGSLPIPTHLPPGLMQDFLSRKAAQHITNKSDERAFLWNAYLIAESPFQK